MALTTTEQINKRLLERADEIYEQAEIQMLENVTKRVKRGITTPGWNEQKLKEVQDIRQTMGRMMDGTNKKMSTEMHKSILESYMSGAKEVKAKGLGLPYTALRDAVPFRLQRVLLVSDNVLVNTKMQVLRSVDDIYKKIMTEASTLSVAGVETVRKSAQRAMDSFALNGITGFTDKLGRKWDLQSYAMMASRTINSNAALQGHMDRMAELGRDLVQVSTKNATCPICAPWGGKILSVSGKSMKYPSLDSAKAAGLFHPNCQHTLLDYDEEMEEIEKEIGIAPEQPKLAKDNDEKYLISQKQRANEANIRKWKRAKAVAFDDPAKNKANSMVRYYQRKQRELLKGTDFARDYGREGLSTGRADKAFVGKDFGTLRFDKDGVPVKLVGGKTKAEMVKEMHDRWAKEEGIKAKETPKVRTREDIKKEMLERSLKEAEKEKAKLKAELLNKLKKEEKIKLANEVIETNNFTNKNIKRNADESWLEYRNRLVLNQSKVPLEEIKTLSSYEKALEERLMLIEDDLEIRAKKGGLYYFPGGRNIKITLEEFKEAESKVLEKLRYVAEKGAIRTRVPSFETLEKIIDDGRFKNQLEVGKSRGSYSPRDRRRATKSLFFVQETVEDAEHEFYGYLGSKDALDDFKNTGSEDTYGTYISVKFKDDIKDYTTMTVGDSLAAALDNQLIPTKVTDVKHFPVRDYDYARRYEKYQKIKDIDVENMSIKKSIKEIHSSYIETQMHGGVTLDMIDSIDILEEELASIPDSLIRKLEKNGIKINKVKHSYRGFWN